ncbi:NAD(P)-dependent alcohol dehydrogenase [Psychroserpens mesophilus]|uniref:NAD(P)-dependent alcohol dehydrogenase n=1 Tax=Psychroserpens mesophilus TaxID=325473 RepID=UPI003D65C0B8
MKAAIYTKYGSPEIIQIVETKKPAPQFNEILVNIEASSVTRADTMMRQGIPRLGRLFLGVFKPKNTALGTGFSGIVEAVGSDVKKFSIGDAVFGEKLFSNGSNADYLCISEDMIIELKPDAISHTQAAPVCDGFLTSYNFLKDIANIQQEHHILINGASGSLGSAAVQLAKLMGAKVTGICNAKNIDFVKTLGADDVIDYTKVNLNELSCKYDVIYDAVGKLSYQTAKKIISSDGIFMTPVLSIQILWQMLWNSKQVKFAATGMKKTKDLKQLFKDLVYFFGQNKLHTTIDRTYGLSDIAKAHQYLETGRKVGNVVIINL